MWNKLKQLSGRAVQFGKSVASEQDGTGSTSRIIGLVIVFVVSVLLMAYFWLHKDFPGEGVLGGLAKILGLGSGAYAANKVSEAVATATAKKPDNPDEAANDGK